MGLAALADIVFRRCQKKGRFVRNCKTPPPRGQPQRRTRFMSSYSGPSSPRQMEQRVANRNAQLVGRSAMLRRRAGGRIQTKPPSNFKRRSKEWRGETPSVCELVCVLWKLPCQNFYQNQQ